MDIAERRRPSASPRPSAATRRRSWLMAAMAVLIAMSVAVPASPSGAATIGDGDGDRLDLTAATEWCETTPEVDAGAVVGGGCRFRPATTTALARGYSRAAFWLRLRLDNGEAVPIRRLLVIGNPRLEHVAFFDLGAEGPRPLGMTGLAVAPAARILPTDDPLLPLDLAPRETRTLLVRVVSRSPINLEPVAWREAAWIAAHDRFVFHVVLANGGLIAAGLFSLLIGLGPDISQWSRRANLFFAVGSFAKALFNLANAAVLPGRLMPADMAYDIRIQGVALTTSVALGILFMRHFLDTQRTRPMLEPTFRVFLAALAVETVWLVAIDYATGFRAAILTAAAVFVVAAFAGWRAFGRGVPGALVLALAWSVYLVLFVHRAVLGFAGGAFGDTLVIAYSWAALSSAPLIPIGIALNEDAIRRELQKARAEADARVAFLAHMSHELRTPLDTILGNAQLMARPGGRVSVAEGVATILDAGRHLLRMIDDILDHARGLAGRLALAPSARSRRVAGACRRTARRRTRGGGGDRSPRTTDDGDRIGAPGSGFTRTPAADDRRWAGERHTRLVRRRGGRSHAHRLRRGRRHGRALPRLRAAERTGERMKGSERNSRTPAERFGPGSHENSP